VIKQKEKYALLSYQTVTVTKIMNDTDLQDALTIDNFFRKKEKTLTKKEVGIQEIAGLF